MCVRARAYMYSHTPAALFMCIYIHEAVHNLAASSDTCNDVTHVACVLNSGVCFRLSHTHSLSLPLYVRVFPCIIYVRVCVSSECIVIINVRQSNKPIKYPFYLHVYKYKYGFTSTYVRLYYKCVSKSVNQ